MGPIRAAACIVSLLLCVSLPLSAKTRKLTVMGTLIEVIAAAGETTDWAIELNPVLMLDGKQISSIEVRSSNLRKLESLRDQPVRAKGRLTYESGVESPRRAILKLSSIKLRKPK